MTTDRGQFTSPTAPFLTLGIVFTISYFVVGRAAHRAGYFHPLSTAVVAGIITVAFMHIARTNKRGAA